MRDLYSVLNLSRRANSKDIKAAYWALAKQIHPDVNAGDQEAERWTKEINCAYEILGDPDARAAYDLELVHQRARARRSFWRSAATGAATFILTAGSISMAVVWKKHALQTRTAKNETLVTKAPEHERATSRPARSELPERGADRGETAPHPEPSSEPPASTSSEVTSAALTDREARTSGVPAPYVESPEVEAKQPVPTPTVDQMSSGEPTRRHGDRKVAVVGSIHKKPKRRSNVATVAATATPNKLQGSEQEPRLVSSGATALRWPTADEPFVNVGVRNR
jgi:DnaJ domain